MNVLIFKIIIVVVAYLIGSVPTAYLVYKTKTGKDIRNEGSGNVGGTNVTRVIGMGFGALTVIADILKGFIPVMVCYILYPGDLILPAITSVAVVFGHDYPIYLKFKGGKGISSSYGVIMALCIFPFAQNLSIWIRLIPLFTILFMWIVTFGVSRIVSLSSLVAAVATPLAFYFSGHPLPVFIASICLFVLTFVAHRDNIRRLIKKEEKKLLQRGQK
jgi:acyl phosphate:glycerol-3-phosphate acyltransferase